MSVEGGLSVMGDCQCSYTGSNTSHVVEFCTMYSVIGSGVYLFNSIYFPSKQQTHLKNTQDGGDATKSKSLKTVAPPLQLKTTTKKQT